MIRLFQTHRIREQIELEGLWDFEPLNSPAPLPDHYHYTLPVPGCWEQHPRFLTYRGLGVYRRKIFLDSDSNLRLEFKGISHTATVFFDGQEVGHHYNAYTPFALVIPAATQGEHELVVLVDNRFSEASALHIPNDYQTYGGIIRPVALEQIPEIFIERVEFTPWEETGIWQGKIKVFLRNISAAKQTVNIAGLLYNTFLNFDPLEIKAGQSALVEKNFSFPGVTAWTSQNPMLYLLELRLFSAGSPEGGAEPYDDLIERVGFRTVKVNGRAIEVNGVEVFLKGFNRHEDYAIVGCAIPLQLMAKDLDLIQDLGANTIRTSHYPNDQRFLDLCDERGFYVWEENHARGLSLASMQNPHFESQCADCNEEMLKYHINHPSIIIWGLLNECSSNTGEGRIMYQKQFAQIRALDPSRPVTTATCQHFSDLCLDLPDIVSLNIYSGWYNDHDISEYLEKELAWVENSGAAGKPVIISEFGAAALYGFREPTRVKWSEERQADILDQSLAVYLHRPEIKGALIWQFCDCRVTSEGDTFQTRPRTRNNKGIVDEYRRPKLAYEIIKKHFIPVQKSL